MTDTPAWPAAVLSFWFDELSEADWFSGGPSIDALIVERFGSLHARLAESLPPGVLTSPTAALACVIVLDQFSRNIHRGTETAFAHDATARRITMHALDQGFDQTLSPVQRNFLYMPLMHSESLEDQQRSVALFTGTPSESYAITHRDIIAQFGRFPYRNDVLGRSTTAEEAEWLENGPRFGQ